ncbi:MAG: hypothetical protein ACRBF0_20595 [Calditrichia bacterium]
MLRNVICAFVLTLALFSSCMSYKSVSRTDSPAIAGERVQVYLNTGEKFTFVVIQATPDSLWGENITIAQSDIAVLKKKKISAGRSLIAGVGLFYLSLVVAVVAGLAALAAAN